MTITVDNVAVELGRPTPDMNSIDAKQWLSWIDRAYRAVNTRAARLGVDVSSINPDTLDDVVLYAVARRVGRPVDGAESVTEQVSVDDAQASDTRKYPTGQGDIFFLDSWWALLGLGESGRGRVGSIRVGVPSWRLPRAGL